METFEQTIIDTLKKFEKYEGLGKGTNRFYEYRTKQKHMLVGYNKKDEIQYINWNGMSSEGISLVYNRNAFLFDPKAYILTQLDEHQKYKEAISSELQLEFKLTDDFIAKKNIVEENIEIFSETIYRIQSKVRNILKAPQYWMRKTTMKKDNQKVMDTLEVTLMSHDRLYEAVSNGKIFMEKDILPIIIFPSTILYKQITEIIGLQQDIISAHDRMRLENAKQLKIFIDYVVKFH
jgi:hypothetical protein